METNDKLLEGRRYGKLTIIKYLYILKIEVNIFYANVIAAI